MTKDCHVRSPLRWPGGKYKIREKIIHLIGQSTRYIEPCVGAGWVYFDKMPSPVEIINDLDAELIHFYQFIRDHPLDFIKTFEWVLCARAEFERLKEIDPETLDPLERAYRFFYLTMASWNGELRFPRFAVAMNDGGHGNRLIGALKTLPERIMPASLRLQNTTISCGDWYDCVCPYEDSTDTLVFLDPPYPGNKVNYLCNMRGWEMHEKMIGAMQRARCRVILSSYDRADVRQRVRDFTVIPVSFVSGMGPERKNREILVANFELPRLDPYWQQLKFLEK